MKKLLWWQLPWVFYCGLIFYLSSLSNPPDTISFPLSDKVKHALLYSILAVLTVQGFYKWPGEFFKRSSLIWAILFCILYGASDEWHQSFVANRVPDIMDWVADVVGIAIGGLAYYIYNKKPSL